MIKDRRIQWKTFTKTPPVYLSRISCHDPNVFKGIPKGIGYRIRITNSTNETFLENVDMYSRALAASGYNYQTMKNELKKLENIDPRELIKSDRKRPKSPNLE